MNKKNFKSVSNYSVPKEWVDNAMNIPKTAKKAPPIYVQFVKPIVAVASLVLVCCVSLLVFFMNSDNAVPPVTDVVETKGNITATEETKDNNESTDSSDFTDKTEQNTSSIDNSTHPAVNETVKPTLPIDPTESPTIAPTQGNQGTDPTEDRNDPLKPSPTDDLCYPTENPTDGSIYPNKPSVPTTEPTESPTSVPTDNRHNVYLSLSIRNKTLTGSGKVYCMTYFNGEICGSSELFSPQHEVEVTYKNNIITTVRYYPYRQGVISRNGVYDFKFYNESGEVVAEASGCY